MKNLSLYTVKVLIETNMFPTSIRTFATCEKDAVNYVSKFLEQHVTYEFNICEVKEDKIEEGVLIY